jgi:fructose/tagatose bisphosphate aldolase
MGFILRRLGNLHGIVRKNDHYVRNTIRSLIRLPARPLTMSFSQQIALHGTDELPDQLWKDCVKAGARKVRITRNQQPGPSGR